MLMHHGYRVCTMSTQCTMRANGASCVLRMLHTTIMLLTLLSLSLYALACHGCTASQHVPSRKAIYNSPESTGCAVDLLFACAPGISKFEVTVICFMGSRSSALTTCANVRFCWFIIYSFNLSIALGLSHFLAANKILP